MEQRGRDLFDKKVLSNDISCESGSISKTMSKVDSNLEAWLYYSFVHLAQPSLITAVKYSKRRYLTDSPILRRSHPILNSTEYRIEASELALLPMLAYLLDSRSSLEICGLYHGLISDVMRWIRQRTEPVV